MINNKINSNPIAGVAVFIAGLILTPIILVVFDEIMKICMEPDMGWVWKPISFLIDYLSWPVSCFFAYLLSYAIGNHKKATNVCAIIICVILIGFTAIALFVSQFFYIPMYLICIAILSFFMWGTMTGQL